MLPVAVLELRRHLLHAHDYNRLESGLLLFGGLAGVDRPEVHAKLQSSLSHFIPNLVGALNAPQTRLRVAACWALRHSTPLMMLDAHEAVRPRMFTGAL